MLPNICTFVPTVEGDKAFSCSTCEAGAAFCTGALCIRGQVCLLCAHDTHTHTHRHTHTHTHMLPRACVPQRESEDDRYGGLVSYIDSFRPPSHVGWNIERFECVPGHRGGFVPPCQLRDSND